MQSLTGFGRFPIVSAGAMLFIIMIGVSLLGVWLRLRLTQTEAGKAESLESSDSLGSVVSAMLGLLGLLLGFTFALAIDRYDTRRALVVEEANAIGSAYLQAQLLDTQDRDRMSDLLRRYTDNRIEIGKFGLSDDASVQAAALQRNDKLVEDLWSATVAAQDHIRGQPFSGTFISTMNGVIDLDTSRKVSRQTRVPNEVFIALFVYITVTAITLGFAARTRTAFGFVCVLHFLISLSLMLILDIDRPSFGGIRETQRPMEMLQASLRTQPPGTFDHWRTPVAEQAR